MLYALPLQVADPAAEPSTKTVINSPLVHVPVKVGVVSLVMLSVLEAPLSLAAIKSGATPGVAGATVSTVMLSAGLSADWLPAASVNREVMLCVPLPSVLAVMV